jgi:hypothetical protein
MSVEKKIQELLQQSKVLSEEVVQDEDILSEEDQTDNKKAVDGAGAVNGKQTATAKSGAKQADKSAKGGAAAAEGSHIAGIKEEKEDEDDEDEDDDDEDDDKEEVVKMKKESSHKMKMKKEDRDIKVDVSEDVAALTSDETLSEEFKQKAATIFEAAVVARVKQELATIEEEFEARLNEEVQQVTEGLVDKVDGYLDYVVEQWMKQNEIALEAGLKSEITENFIGGLKSLFEEHYIDIPEEKYDLVGELEQRATDAEEKLNEAIAQSIELKKQLDENTKKEIVGDLKAGLTETEVEKFTSLAAEIVFESADSYKEKLTTIRESYFKSEKSEVKGGVEDEATPAEQKVMVESIARYAQALGKFKK